MFKFVMFRIMILLSLSQFYAPNFFTNYASNRSKICFYSMCFDLLRLAETLRLSS